MKICERTGQNLNAKSINAKLSALIKYNELMQPDNIVISKADLIKVQAEIISPTNITKKEVEEFRQRVLQSEGCSAKRNYAIVTIMAYAGLRISEVLHLKKVDVNTAASQIRVADGKGEKQRTVIINSKVISAIREYGDGKQREKLNKNKIFYNLFKKKNIYGQIKVNECKFRKYSQDYDMFTSMKELGHKGYLEDILEESLTSNAEEMVCNVEEMDKFILFLKSIEGKRLYVEDQQYIKEEFETSSI